MILEIGLNQYEYDNECVALNKLRPYVCQLLLFIYYI